MARAMATRCCWPPEKLVGLVGGAVAQAHQLQRDGGMAAAPGGGQPGQEQRQFDVLLGRECRQQVIELEDETDVGRPPARQLGGGQALDLPAGDPQGAVGGDVQTRRSY